MKTRLIILLAIFIITSCKSASDNAPTQNKLTLQEEVNAANTVEKQTEFFTTIRKSNKSLRINFKKLEKELNPNSEELKKAKEEFDLNNQNNLKRIEAYITTYGYPKKDLHGTPATNTPYIIIEGHSDYDKFRKYARILYDANQDGNLRTDNVNYYLNRIYSYKFDGKGIEWGRPYRSEEELDTLLKTLDLIEMANEVKSEKSNPTQ